MGGGGGYRGQGSGFSMTIVGFCFDGRRLHRVSRLLQESGGVTEASLRGAGRGSGGGGVQMGLSEVTVKYDDLVL